MGFGSGDLHIFFVNSPDKKCKPLEIWFVETRLFVTPKVGKYVPWIHIFLSPRLVEREAMKVGAPHSWATKNQGNPSGAPPKATPPPGTRRQQGPTKGNQRLIPMVNKPLRGGVALGGVARIPLKECIQHTSDVCHDSASRRIGTRSTTHTASAGRFTKLKSGAIDVDSGIVEFDIAPHYRIREVFI